MMSWLSDIFKGGADVLELHLALASKQVRQAGLMLVALIAMGLVGGAAICGVLVGIVVLIAQQIGFAAAILIISGIVVALLCAALLAAYRKTAHSIGRLEAKAAAARRHVDELVNHDSAEKNKSSLRGSAGMQSILDAFKGAASSPKVVISTAFALLGVLGIRRTLKLARAVSFLVSAGGVASKVASTIPPGNLNGWFQKATASGNSRRG